MHSISRPDIVYEVLQLANQMQKSRIRIALGWVPAHMGVKVNELADRYAKQEGICTKFKEELGVAGVL